jgi:hypothetical protein
MKKMASPGIGDAIGKKGSLLDIIWTRRPTCSMR